MKRLIQYIKDGQGRGLKAMLIFSAITAILSWVVFRPVLAQMPTMDPRLQQINSLWLHVGFILGSFVLLWILYLLVVAISALICRACRLPLNKGMIWRATMLTMIGLFLVKVLQFVMQLILVLLSQQLAGILVPVAVVIVPVIFVVVIIAFGICDKKAKKVGKK